MSVASFEPIAAEVSSVLRVRPTVVLAIWVGVVVSALCWACRTVALADSTSFCRAVMPLSAASSTLVPCVMSSSRRERSLPRLLSPDATKKLRGSSSAELTFFPVANRFWAVDIISAVLCSDSRLLRMLWERITSAMLAILCRAYPLG